MTTNKIHSDTVFAKRVIALGINYVQLSKLTGYKLGSLHNYSNGTSQPSEILNTYLTLLEVLKEQGMLHNLLDKYPFGDSTPEMSPSSENKTETMERVDRILDEIARMKSTLANLEIALASMSDEVKKIAETSINNDVQD